MKEFMYLSENEKFNGGYTIIPNGLYTLSFYKGLSNDAILLYGILLNRLKLSKKNSKFNKNGRVYVEASIASIMELLDVSKGTARKVVTELEEFLLLKIEKDDGYNNKRRLYLGSISKEKNMKSGNKIWTMEGSNKELSGDKIYTMDGSNNEASRGQNLYPNKNINKYNIKNSQTQWGNGGACENSNDFDFSD